MPYIFAKIPSPADWNSNAESCVHDVFDSPHTASPMLFFSEVSVAHDKLISTCGIIHRRYLSWTHTDQKDCPSLAELHDESEVAGRQAADPE